MNFLENFLRISNWQTLLFIILILLTWGIMFFLGRKNRKRAWPVKIGIGLVAGIVFGLLFSALNDFQGRAPEATRDANHWLEQIYYWTTSVINTIFYRSVLFMLPFLLFASMTHTMSTIRRSPGRVVGKSVGSLFLMYFSGLLLAVFVVLLLNLIDFSTVLGGTQPTPRDIVPIATTFTNFIPRSITTFFESGVGVISAVVAGAVVGIALNKMIKRKPDSKVFLAIERGLSGFHSLINKVVKLVIAYLPYAIIGFLTRAFVRFGTNTLVTAGLFLGLMYLILILQISYLTSVNWFVTKFNPLKIFKRVYRPLASAFFTQSSASTIPLTRKTLIDNFNVNETTASIVPTFGATGLMVACSGSYPLLAATVVANASGIPLDASFMIQLIVVITVVSFGIAGVPGTATIGTTNVFAAMNLDFGVLGIIFGVDAIIDMGRTLTNVYGAMSGSIWAQSFIDRAGRKPSIISQIRQKRSLEAS